MVKGPEDKPRFRFTDKVVKKEEAIDYDKSVKPLIQYLRSIHHRLSVDDKKLLSDLFNQIMEYKVANLAASNIARKIKKNKIEEPTLDSNILDQIASKTAKLPKACDNQRIKVLYISLAAQVLNDGGIASDKFFRALLS